MKLTERQETALKMVGLGYIPTYIVRSLPSLIRRGLVVQEMVSGRRTGRYFLTEAGAEEHDRIRGR